MIFFGFFVFRFSFYCLHVLCYSHCIVISRVCRDVMCFVRIIIIIVVIVSYYTVTESVNLVFSPDQWHQSLLNFFSTATRSQSCREVLPTPPPSLVWTSRGGTKRLTMGASPVSCRSHRDPPIEIKVSPKSPRPRAPVSMHTLWSSEAFNGPSHRAPVIIWEASLKSSIDDRRENARYV